MTTDLLIPVTAALMVGAAAGLVGSLMVLRRMALVGDALSHVALPGLAVALIVGAEPFIGAFAALLIAVTGIWLLERRTGLPTEALVGIFFTVSLAGGILLTPEHELLEALLGDLTAVTPVGALWAGTAVLLIAPAAVRIARPVLLGILSPDLARASGVRLDRANFLFLLMVAAVVALGIRITGTLLTGALVIVPAAAARNITSSLARFMALSALLGAVAGGAGTAAAAILGIPPGPAVVLIAGALFAFTLPFRR